MTLFKRERETEEQIIIRWADEIMAIADHAGNVDLRTSFNLNWEPDDGFTEEQQTRLRVNIETRRIRDLVISKLGDIDGNINLITKELTKYHNSVRQFLLDEGYMIGGITAHHETFLILTDKGKLAKELGGHEKYQKYRRSEINLIRSQGKINAWLIAAAILAGLVPLGTFVVDKIWFTEKPQSEPVHHIEVKIDANSLNKNVEPQKSQPPSKK